MTLVKDSNLKGYLGLSVGLAFVLSEFVLLIFFWPLTLSTGSLFLTVGLYVLLGLAQAKVEGRLFSQVVREYLVIAAFVFVTTLFVTRWS
jgi:hypothetical protein